MANASPSFTGVPKSGVPSVFHVNFCARGERCPPHPWPGSGFAWYRIQSCFPSGDLKKELWPGAYTLFSGMGLNTGSGDFFQEAASSKLLFADAVSMPNV